MMFMFIKEHQEVFHFSIKVAAISRQRNDSNVGKDKLFSWFKLW